MKALDDQIAQLRNDVKITQQEIESKSTARRNLIDEQRRLIEQLKPSGSRAAKLREERKRLLDQVKAIGELRGRKIDELTKLKEKLPPKLESRGSGSGDNNNKTFNLKNVLENIDLEIIKHENKLKVTSMSLTEEKKVIQEIGNLKNAKAVAKEYDQQRQKLQVELDAEKADKAKMSEQIKDLDEQITQIRDNDGKYQKELEEIRNKIKTLGDELPGLIAKRDALRTQIDQCYADKSEVNKRRNEDEAEFTVYMDKVREARAEQRAKLSEIRAVERAEKAKERAVEQLTETPFEEELEVCDRLISYLEQFVPKADAAVDKPDEQPAEPTPNANAKFGPKEGERILKRDDDDEDLFKTKGKGKPKQAPKPKTTSYKPDTVLKHQWNVLTQFELLSLGTPLTAGDASKSIDELKQKKEHFVKLGVEKKKQLEAQVAKQRAEDAAKAAAEASSSGAGDDDAKDDTANDDDNGDGSLVEASA